MVSWSADSASFKYGSSLGSFASSEDTGYIGPTQDVPSKRTKKATFGGFRDDLVHERIDEDKPALQSGISCTSLAAASMATKSHTSWGMLGSTESVYPTSSVNSSNNSKRLVQLTRRKSGVSYDIASPTASKMGNRVLAMDVPLEKKSSRRSIAMGASQSDYAHHTTSTRRGSVQGSDFPEMVSASTKIGNSVAPGTTWLERKRICKKMKTIARNWLDSYGIQCVMALLTVFVLVGDDIRVLAFEKSADWIFNVFAIVCLFLFTLELTVSSCVKDDYFLGFWFVMDAISTASLIFDITYVNEAIDPPPELSLDNPDSINSQNSAVGQSEYARASRSSRVGTRVARLLRVVRLIRISRITNFLSFQRKQDSDSGMSPGEDIDKHLDPSGGSESRIGRKLSERVTQRVIILVLIMLFCIPQLNPGLHHLMMSSSAEYGADVVFANWVDYEEQYLKNSSAASLLEPLRRIWETDLLMYIYYHNWHSTYPEESRSSMETNAADWLMSLCFIGYLVNKAAEPDVLDNTQQGYIQVLSPTVESWDGMFSPSGWDFNKYIVGMLPDAIKQALVAPWTTDCSEESDFYGVSLLPDTPCPRKVLRKEETMWYLPSGAKLHFSRHHMQGQFVFLFDLRRRIAVQAVMSISQTVFTVIVLAIGALGFSKDADRLVLAPIERMIRNVIIIRRDPLYSIKLAEKHQKDVNEEDNIATASTTTVPRFRRMLGCCGLSTADLLTSRLKSRLGIQRRQEKQRRRAASKKVSAMETMILENVIMKLGSLLVLGFGDAGSEIIKLNMDDDIGTVDALIPGSKVEGIYGFCSIRHFATTINVLQEKTMVYVNQVAEIVHRVVDEHLGAANKNVGEAFLLVWRLSSYAPEHRSRIADLAVLSFVQVMVELSRDVRLSEYREHPALLARLPNFRVTMGFGLHSGWSIEGAIGSEFKIDASYLSPHVNLATMLEAVTDEYGVSVLMSEPLVMACSVLFRRHFRVIDHVKFFGSKFPIRLFTVDLNQEALPVDVDDIAKRHKPRLTREVRDENKRGRLEDDSSYANTVFDKDVNVIRMRERYFLGFLQQFEKGYLNYEAGEWGVATQVLTQTMTMLRRCSSDGLVVAEDGPSKVLVEFMERHNCEKPEGWLGYRELSEKGSSARNLEAFDEFSEGILGVSTT